MSSPSIRELSGISACDLRQKLDMVTPPFDPFEVARRLGIEVSDTITWDKLEISGLITRKKKKVTIWVNPYDPEVRRRFTLAHELGHYVNDILVDGENEVSDTPETLYRNGSDDPKEVRANNFAAELLMPTVIVLEKAFELIKQAPSETMFAADLVAKLAVIFKVSKPAMTIRLKRLGLVKQNSPA